MFVSYMARFICQGKRFFGFRSLASGKIDRLYDFRGREFGSVWSAGKLDIPLIPARFEVFPCVRGCSRLFLFSLLFCVLFS